jgi:hypothetical protein
MDLRPGRHNAGADESGSAPSCAAQQKADPGSLMFGIPGDGGQSLTRDTEQNVVNHLVVLQSDRCDFFKNRDTT